VHIKADRAGDVAPAGPRRSSSPEVPLPSQPPEGPAVPPRGAASAVPTPPLAPPSSAGGRGTDGLGPRPDNISAGNFPGSDIVPDNIGHGGRALDDIVLANGGPSDHEPDDIGHHDLADGDLAPGNLAQDDHVHGDIARGHFAPDDIAHGDIAHDDFVDGDLVHDQLHGLHDEHDHHEYEDLPGEARRGHRALAIIGVFALVIGLLGGGGWWWYQRQVHPPGGPGAAVTVDVPEGATTSDIGDLLNANGVVSSSWVFTYYAGHKHAGPFQAGRYLLRKHSDMDVVLRTLRAGPKVAALTRISIPEGFTVAQLSARLSKRVPRFTPAAILAALGSGKVKSKTRPTGQSSWEGLLFPATYDVEPTTTLVGLLQDMANRMDGEVSSLASPSRLAAIQAQYGVTLTPYQAVIVASLIQREAGGPDETGKIATVIYNRLKQGSPLGIDATSRYYATLTGRPLDFSVVSPFNTRRSKGLPPNPIAIPSADSLNGALNPVAGPWIYYVLTDPGHHTFVTTDQEFIAAKQVCKLKGLGCG
ncbi:MAG: putative periplasmic solute-binding protein, partial [Acidimicrobiales bacterium]|nr:putative periplasmic solute-binding protein [Acidimicrobiales bacterium]